MPRHITYNTKQREAVLNYVISLEGAHVTAAQIVEHFENEDAAIGRTTIYRHLEKLTKIGKIRRYITDGVTGACYQFVDDNENCHVHFHLKCEVCGELQHLECEVLTEIQSHIFEKHAFEINALKTVFYGKCDSCRKRA